MKVKKKNKVLVIGNSGREHALIEKIKKSPYCEEVYTTNNDFSIFAKFIECDLEQDKSFLKISYCCKISNIDLVIVNSEEYLSEGITDVLENEGIKVFGPNKNAAKLEYSKSFTKELCSICNIPTPKYNYFINTNNAKKYIDKLKLPVVIKTDGFSVGNDIFMCDSLEEAYQAIDDILNGKFGAHNKTVIVEEYLKGKEIGVFALFDGQEIIILDAVQSYKTIEIEGKKYNTSGLGAFSPTKSFLPIVKSRVMSEILYPTINSFKDVGIKYRGILFANIILTKSGPKLLDYNVRLSDPETQVLLQRMNFDILELILLTINGKLSKANIEFHDNYTVCIVMATKGYPVNYSLNYEIKGLDKVREMPNIQILYSGAYEKDNKVFSKGGRVINIVSTDTSLLKARKQAYKAVEMIDWPEGFYIDNISVQ